MKRITLLLFLVATMGFSQIVEPVKWKTSVKKISESTYDLVFTATIDDTWHLYSQKTQNDGPKTVFTFKPNSNYELVGKTSEEKGHTAFEEVLDMEVTYFEGKAEFTQRIKTTTKKAFNITGDIDFMSCNNRSCVPGYDDFSFKI